jgi:tetratricopeptide (TPR) repeat protein
MTAAAIIDRTIVGCLRTGASYVDPNAYLIVPQSAAGQRARGLLASGAVDDALAEADRCLKAMPGNMDLVIAMLPELEHRGRKKDADAMYARVSTAYEGLCKSYPRSAWGHNSCAWLSANCKRELDRALEHALKAVELAPEMAGYFDTLAEVRFRRGERQEALVAIKKALELEPKNGYYGKQLVRMESAPFDSPTPDSDVD